MEKVTAIFENFLEIHDARCLKLVQEHEKSRRYKKGEILLRAGEIQSEIPFIVSGSFWCYYTDSIGRRYMECIVDQKGFPVTPIADMRLFNKPSDEYIEALEPSEAVCLPTEIVVRMLTEYPEAANAMSRLVSGSVAMHREFQMWANSTVLERYNRFCKAYPRLAKTLTKTSIAAILNTNLPALSRAINGK